MYVVGGLGVAMSFTTLFFSFKTLKIDAHVLIEANLKANLHRASIKLNK